MTTEGLLPRTREQMIYYIIFIFSKFLINIFLALSFLENPNHSQNVKQVVVQTTPYNINSLYFDVSKQALVGL